MLKKNILVYPSGAENAIEIYNSIKDSVHINVIPASGKLDHSELIYENEVAILPYVQSDNFIHSLNTLIRQKKIHFIFPTHDTVSLFLAENKEDIDCEIITSGFNANYICRYKRETYQAFKGYDFCPTLFEDLRDGSSYPIFSKPNIGQGSKGVSLVNTISDHISLQKSRDDLLFMEYLPGKEFTIDCFTNRNGVLQFIGPRERVEVQMGISFRSREVKKDDWPRFLEIANQINDKLKFRGLWFFQLKEDKYGTLKLLEISTRASGTMGYFRHKGVNLPLLSLFDFLDLNVEIELNNYEVELFRSTKNRYKYSFEYNSVYLDFDDTLITNGHVNITVLAFVYQCKNLNKKVYLLTKHVEDIEKTLRKFNISKTLFDNIMVLKVGEKKIDFIEAKNSIFIDNWYAERKEVSKLQIPVFDVDAVNSLLRI